MQKYIIFLGMEDESNESERKLKIEFNLCNRRWI